MYFIPIIGIVILVITDQLSKYIASVYLQPVGTFEVITNIFSLTYVLNDGAAFGMFAGGRWFFVGFSFIILIGIGYYYVKLPRGKVYTWMRLSLILISAGAIGNLIDRILNGAVIDFLHVRFVNFPVFNVADIYVVTGAVLMAVLVIFFMKEEQAVKVEKAAEEKQTTDEIQGAVEGLPAEENQTAEEKQVDEIQGAVEEQSAQENQTAEENQMIEEIQLTEEKQAVKEEKQNAGEV